MDALEDVTGRWADWRGARPEPSATHFDSAAAGRSSHAVLSAVSAHALSEARSGAYVAQEMAAALLSEGRCALGQLLGMPEDGIAFVESATVALGTLLDAWNLGLDATVAVAPSEWGPNLNALRRRGLRLVLMPVDDAGHVELGAFTRLLESAPPSAVHITHVASHRSLVQPVAEMAAACRAAAVPLFVDAAQALGHVDTSSGADAVYATSRKWLAGPRGVGVLAVSDQWFDRVRANALAEGPLAGDEPAGVLLSSRESHVAGRVGFSVAVTEHRDAGPPAVWERLAAIGRATRHMLDDLENWEVAGPPDDPTAITALEPRCGQDVAEVRNRLLHDHRIVTTAQQRFRAPQDMTVPTLRVSPHLDVTTDELARLRSALASL